MAQSNALFGLTFLPRKYTIRAACKDGTELVFADAAASLARRGWGGPPIITTYGATQEVYYPHPIQWEYLEDWRFFCEEEQQDLYEDYGRRVDGITYLEGSFKKIEVIQEQDTLRIRIRLPGNGPVSKEGYFGVLQRLFPERRYTPRDDWIERVVHHVPNWGVLIRKVGERSELFVPFEKLVSLLVD